MNSWSDTFQIFISEIDTWFTRCYTLLKSVHKPLDNISPLYRSGVFIEKSGGTVNKNNVEQIEFLINRFEEIDGYDFYQFLFPNNEFVREFNNDFSKPNAIFLYSDLRDKDSKRRLRRRIMLKDTFENDYMEYIERNEYAICGGLSYRRRANKIQNAQHMNALIFDLDGVGENELKNLFLRFDQDPLSITGRTLPMPTFIVSSGSGIHLYYVLDKPLELFPYIKTQLKSLKNDLTFKLWEYKATTQNKDIQRQSINQSFRMVGSINQKYGNVVRAFSTGEKVSLDYLNAYVKEKSRVHLEQKFKPTSHTLEEAKEKFPEWFEKCIVQGIKDYKKWSVSPAVYDWWKSQISKVIGGHRYHFMMCLAVYAYKCDISRHQLKKDLYEIFDEVAKIKHENALTEFDIMSALEAYDDALYLFRIEDISAISGIRIDKNKRNYRKRDKHLEYMRGVKQLKKNMGEEIKEGRPSKEIDIKAYIKEHPGSSVSQIAKALKVSRTTVYKFK